MLLKFNQIRGSERKIFGKLFKIYLFFGEFVQLFIFRCVLIFVCVEIGVLLHCSVYIKNKIQRIQFCEIYYFVEIFIVLKYSLWYSVNTAEETFNYCNLKDHPHGNLMNIATHTNCRR